MGNKRVTFYQAGTNVELSSFMRSIGLEKVYNLSKADFLLLPGGVDISPSLYFEDPDPSVKRVSPSRDFHDMVDIIDARIDRKPIVGICRGAQLYHVSLGGSLIQHVEGHRECSHGIKGVRKGDREFFLLKEGVKVTSSHHQAIPIAQALKLYDATLISEVEEGRPMTTEMFYHKAGRALGVQFHPEYVDASDDCVELFVDSLNKLLRENGICVD